MEYSKEQVLRLADSLEICVSDSRSCDECMFDKTCALEGGSNNILKEAAKVIRELVEGGCCGNCNNQEAADNPSVSCADSSLSTGEPLKGEAWQMGLYERAIEKFGVEKQVTKAVEEMGELIVELSRWQIDHQTEEKHLMAQIREELADVCIMCDQLQLIFGDVSDWEMYELERLERLERGL